MAMREWKGRPMKPLFSVLKANHMGRAVPMPKVYEAIGLPKLAQEPAWGNTCAIRMSVALVAAGMKIRTGKVRLRINAGAHKGEPIEPSQRVLSDFLARELGKPEKFRNSGSARDTIAARRGIISFFQLYGPSDRQGHIDLVSATDWTDLMCSGSCYWEAVDIWFWPLK